MRSIIALLLLGAAVAPAASQTTKLPSLFGLQLGAPISLPTCAYYNNDPSLGYDMVPKQMCIELPTVKNGELYPTSRVWFEPEHAPAIVKNWQMLAVPINGQLAGLRFYTSGLSIQNAVLVELTNKFGKPTSVSNHALQNSMGATFSAIDARWVRPGFSVHLDGVKGSIDLGMVTIETPPAAALRANAEAKELAKHVAF